MIKYKKKRSEIINEIIQRIDEKYAELDDKIKSLRSNHDCDIHGLKSQVTNLKIFCNDHTHYVSGGKYGRQSASATKKMTIILD